VPHVFRTRRGPRLHLAFPLLAAFLALGAPADPRASAAEGVRTYNEVPAYDASGSDAPRVTEANLLESERFWPFKVALRRPWTPPGGDRPLSPRFPGVLVRVEVGGTARVDFGRDGLHDVPVVETDLVERAERVRRGELAKQAPNFLWLIVPRLKDAEFPTLRPLPWEPALGGDVFLCVFADPGAEGFPELAASLAPLRGRHRLLTLFFPQGRHADPAVRERLRALDWPVPFVQDHLAEAYTAVLMDAGTEPPALLVVTDEGRLLHQGPLAAEGIPEAIAAIDAALTTSPAAKAAFPARPGS